MSTAWPTSRKSSTAWACCRSRPPRRRRPRPSPPIRTVCRLFLRPPALPPGAFLCEVRKHADAYVERTRARRGMQAHGAWSAGSVRASPLPGRSAERADSRDCRSLPPFPRALSLPQGKCRAEQAVRRMRRVAAIACGLSCREIRDFWPRNRALARLASVCLRRETCDLAFS